MQIDVYVPFHRTLVVAQVLADEEKQELQTNAGGDASEVVSDKNSPLCTPSVDLRYTPRAHKVTKVSAHTHEPKQEGVPDLPSASVDTKGFLSSNFCFIHYYWRVSCTAAFTDFFCRNQKVFSR